MRLRDHRSSQAPTLTERTVSSNLNTSYRDRSSLFRLRLTLTTRSCAADDPLHGDHSRPTHGFFLGGSDLAGANQRYSYTVIPETGQFLIKQGTGNETAAGSTGPAMDTISELDAKVRATNSWR